MYTCYSLLKIIALEFILIFMIKCQEKNKFLQKIDKNYCPFIETLSFGSDINIKCNNTYLIFNEINSDTLNWKFVNQTSICNQNGAQKAYINQCGVNRIDSNYLKVELKSLENNEKACVYCRINYKPIAPLINVTQSNDGEYTLYTFNITATGLAYDESFEILWAKRVNDEFQHSFNYWFLQECVDFIVKILEDTGHRIIFSVDDVTINRVEFIIRRCNGICRNYDQCSGDEFTKKIDLIHFEIPDSIEKISCDYDCLNGIITTITSPSTTITTHHSSTISSTNTTLFNIEQRMKIILLIIIGLIIIISLIIFIHYIYCRIKRKKHIYSKTSNVDPDEHK